MKIALLNDTENFENIGSQLTSGCLKLAILEVFSELDPMAQIESWPWKWGKNSRRMRSFLASVPFFLARTAESASFLRWLNVLSKNEYGKDACQSALEADLVVFQPEGSFYEGDDIYKLIAILSLPTLCQRVGKRVVCLNGTFPEYPDSRADLIRLFLRDCRWVALRDRRSADYYKVDFIPDLAFSYRPKAPNPEPARNQSGSVLVTTGARFSKKMNMELARIALGFCRDEGLRPLVLTKLGSHLEELTSEIESMDGRLFRHPNLSSAVALIDQCCLHIGGRYHMAILALTLSVPSVLVRTNTHKNEWLSSEITGIEVAPSWDEIPDLGKKLMNQSNRSIAGMSEDLERMRKIIGTNMPAICAHSGNDGNPFQAGVTLKDGESLEEQLDLSDLVVGLFRDQNTRLHKKLRQLRMKALLAKNKVLPVSLLPPRQR